MGKRAAGILMPISSLPSDYGIGCFSKSAYEFVDWLKEAGQTYWQILPLGPTSYGDSPYQSFSTFAGNPYFIDLDELATMIVAASVQNKVNGIINVCTGQPRTLADRVEQFLRDKNYKIKLDYGVFPDRPYDSPGVWGDPTKINAILKDAGLA